MINTRFNKLTVVAEAGKDKWNSRMVECRCDCGNKVITRLSDMKRSKTLQCIECGYKFKRRGIPVAKSPLCGKGNNYRHGMSKTLIYKVWASMIKRCKDTKGRNYKWYGSRGIKVCSEWLNFENFYQDMGDKPPKYYMDRIDNDLGYFKENCRWVNSFVNSRNRRCVKN